MILINSSKNQFINNLKKHKSDFIWFWGSLRNKELTFFEIFTETTHLGSGFYFDRNKIKNLSFFINKNNRRKGYGKRLVVYLNQNFKGEIQFDIDKKNRESIFFFESFMFMKKNKINQKTITFTMMDNQ